MGRLCGVKQCKWESGSNFKTGDSRNFADFQGATHVYNLLPFFEIFLQRRQVEGGLGHRVRLPLAPAVC